jgi:Fe-Mn family superoxide dismutase
VSTAYSLPPLPYAYDALEPWCSAATLELHHDKHHQAYVDGANEAAEGIRQADPDDKPKMAGLLALLEFNLGGHVLHSLFWENLSPSEVEVPGALAARFDADFGGRQRAEQLLTAACTGVRGSGWGVLAFDPLGDRLHIGAVGDHQRQFAPGLVTLGVIDVWEHAYYLVHKNDRPGWVKQAVAHLDWGTIDARLAAAVAAAPDMLVTSR